jgi:hypothetical protein
MRSPRTLLAGALGLVLLALVAVLVARGGTDPASAAGGRLLVGLHDDRLAAVEVDPAGRTALAAGLRAEAVRFDLRWDLVAARRPARPRDPADPAYDWRHYDRVVDAARARGLTSIVAIWGTPAWAAAPGVRDGGFPAWGRRPRSPADAGAFAAAVAARYGPRGVRMYEAWNEPNIPLFLRPQYRKVRGRWVPASPAFYAKLLTAMRTGIRSVQPTAQVAGGVTAPTGDMYPQSCPVQPNCRIRPQDFVRYLSAPGLRPRMDAWSHHPYPLRRPADSTPPNRGYVDLYNLPVLFRALDAGYLRRIPVWLTEFGVATRRVEQYPFHVGAADQARYLSDAMRRVRATPRVRVFVWYMLQDHEDWASGLLTRTGARKPAAAAFRREARR